MWHDGTSSCYYYFLWGQSNHHSRVRLVCLALDDACCVILIISTSMESFVVSASCRAEFWQFWVVSSAARNNEVAKVDKSWCKWPCSSEGLSSVPHSDSQKVSHSTSRQPPTKSHNIKEPRSLGALLTRKFFRYVPLSNGRFALGGLCGREWPCDHFSTMMNLPLILTFLAGY